MKLIKTIQRHARNLSEEYWGFILLFFIIRLYGITDPPLEIQHSWRQCTGLMIARNFLTIDANILYPRVNESCGISNVISGEFQLLSYLHYILSFIFGYEHWYGRLINLIISSLGIASYGYLISKLFDGKTARNSVLALIASCWFIFSRKMMPDTFCISLVLISFYFAYQYWNTKALHHLILFFIFFTLGGLSKIPAIIYYTIPFYLLIFKRNPTSIKLASLTAISATIVFIWYFIWGPYVSLTYGNWTNLGKPLLEGINDIISHPRETVFNIVFHSFNSYILFALVLWGIYTLIRKNEKHIWLPIVMISAIFSLYIFKAGYFFYHHNYYMIPFLPVLAFIIAYGLNHSKNKLILFLFLAGITESIANQQHDFRIKESELYKLTLKEKLDRLDKSKNIPKILINTHSNPQQLYLANRNGCYINEAEMTDTIKLNSYRNKNYYWLVIDKKYGYQKPILIKAFEDENYIIYKL
jgi:hypothetical protein